MAPHFSSPRAFHKRLGIIDAQRYSLEELLTAQKAQSSLYRDCLMVQIS